MNSSASMQHGNHRCEMDRTERLAPGHRVIRCGPCSFKVETRSAMAGLLLVVALVAVATLALAGGPFPLRVGDIFAALLGVGDERAQLVVIEWRLPRVLGAVLIGMALGVSGAIFQSLTRNPLGSPDVIGFSAGSYTGALIVLLHLGGSYWLTASGAVAGGLGAAVLVYALAWRGGVDGFRMILVGIGVSAILGAFNMWMIRQASLQAALGAAFWGAGSLNGLGFEHIRLAALTLAVFLPASAYLARAMRQMELGDDVARATGVPVARVRFALMFVGVALTATATAVAGPITFIALVAPQVARRVSATAGVSILASALFGGMLLLLADLAVQRAFGNQLPVGVMTVVIGGLYFIWLLVREARS
ncbi:FecCD family ABC transporter permease [Ensifer adhaerens]|uniref:FecCD family ABC transporter permease n=1 Tax=Ensifer adhaerens TaxID=106592 RepID=UPI003D00F500